MTICCSDCNAELSPVEATPRRLRRGERLCTRCWLVRLKNKTLPIFESKRAEDERLVDSLLDGLRVED